MNFSPKQSKISLPSHSEWGILNELKRQQYEQSVKLQKQAQQQKKQAFRSQLDKQMRMKSKNSSVQKDMDKSYYEFILDKTKKEENQEKQQKLQKYYLRREIQNLNQKNLWQQKSQNSRLIQEKQAQQQKFVIGYRNENNSKQNQLKTKKMIMDELNQQVRRKSQVKITQRVNEINNFYKDLQKQDQQSYNMAKSQQIKKKRFVQNPQVYQHYSNIYHQKDLQQKKYEDVFVNQAMLNKKVLQQKIDSKKMQDQFYRKKQMKDTLDQQVRQHRIQSLRQKQPKPQQISYSFLGNMLDPQSKSYGKYDRKQYNNYLQKQMQSQRLNKKKLQFMDERQYLLNLNQINKALGGTSLNKSYQDNSSSNFGNNSRYDSKQSKRSDLEEDFESRMPSAGSKYSINTKNLINPEQGNSSLKIQDKDKQIVKHNLQELLKKHSSMQQGQSIQSAINTRVRRN